VVELFRPQFIYRICIGYAKTLNGYQYMGDEKDRCERSQVCKYILMNTIGVVFQPLIADQIGYWPGKECL